VLGKEAPIEIGEDGKSSAPPTSQQRKAERSSGLMSHRNGRVTSRR